MKPIYRYIVIWPSGNLHLYVAHTINEVVDDLYKSGYNPQYAKFIKRLAVRNDFQNPNNISLGNSSPRDVVIRNYVRRTVWK